MHTVRECQLMFSVLQALVHVHTINGCVIKQQQLTALHNLWSLTWLADF